MKKLLLLSTAASLFLNISCSSTKSVDGIESSSETGVSGNTSQATPEESGNQTGDNHLGNSADTFKTNGGFDINISALPHQKSDATTKVYFISDITPESLVKVYQQLNWKPEGKVGVKMSTGESEKSNHLRPELIKDLVHAITVLNAIRAASSGGK